MSNTAGRRLVMDIKKMEENKYEGIDAVPNADNLYQW
jgi:hypothetical protein